MEKKQQKLIQYNGNEYSNTSRTLNFDDTQSKMNIVGLEFVDGSMFPQKDTYEAGKSTKSNAGSINDKCPRICSANNCSTIRRASTLPSIARLDVPLAAAVTDSSLSSALMSSNLLSQQRFLLGYVSIGVSLKAILGSNR